MGTPDTDRVLAVDEAADKFGRQVVGTRLFLADRALAGFDAIEKGVILGALETIEERVVFGAGQGHGIGFLAHRYISLRWATRSKMTVAAARSIRQTARQSPCRTRPRSSWPRIVWAVGCVAKGSAAKVSTLMKSARRSRSGSAASSFAARAETINFKLASSPPATAQSTTFCRRWRHRDAFDSFPGPTRSSNETP